MSDAVARLESVRAEIVRAARDFGRDPASITLVAVSKTFPADAIEPVLEAGQRVFGENYVQEAKGKWPPLRERYPDVERINHVHHAGNSSGIVDGAAGVLFGGREIGEALGLKPRARIRGMASIGSEPSIMLTGPEAVTSKLLKKLGMQPEDIDLYELNEAFASVVLRLMQALDIPPDKMNVNGGSIAMGHPLGATGAMILGTALDELERSDKETALITLCVGAGMGTATIIERV